jgi:hypothetical protein
MGIGWWKWRVGCFSHLGWFSACFGSIQTWGTPQDLRKNRGNVHFNGPYWRKIAQKMRTVESVIEKKWSWNDRQLRKSVQWLKKDILTLKILPVKGKQCCPLRRLDEAVKM